MVVVVMAVFRFDVAMVVVMVMICRNPHVFAHLRSRRIGIRRPQRGKRIWYRVQQFCV
jgi:hypothetical protein